MSLYNTVYVGLVNKAQIIPQLKLFLPRVYTYFILKFRKIHRLSQELLPSCYGKSRRWIFDAMTAEFPYDN